MKQDTKWRLRDREGKEYIIIDTEKVDIQEELNKMITKQMKEIERLNNIINTILNFDFFKDECPLNFCYTEKCDEEEAQNVFYEDDYCEENCDDNNYKKCWLKYFKKLQELKGSDKE